MRSADIATITLGSILAALLIVVLASIIMQCCADQCYSLTQRLFPALNRAGYEYWLDWGTLLGARRAGNMIPHDYDADIGMRESEFQRLRSDWKKNPAFRGMRLSKENSKLYRIRSGLGWVDVFRYEDKDNDDLCMLSMANERHSCKCKGNGHTTSSSTIFPLKTVKFGNVHDAPAPALTDDYLEHLYGSTWRIPRYNSVSSLMNLVPVPRKLSQ